jgi:hypothetical protein
MGIVLLIYITTIYYYYYEGKVLSVVIKNAWIYQYFPFFLEKCEAG